MPEVEVNITASRKTSQNESRPRGRPATTLKGREDQLIALAVDVAEDQLRRGTASAQVITHYLKLGTTREQLEQERLTRENALLTAKVESLASAKRVEELYANALKAMRVYSGNAETDEYSESEMLFRAGPDQRFQGEIPVSSTAFVYRSRQLRI
jgi:hypothetical protein